jgi:catechol 2,3-dioxygenase-like lactoylglutathione lyase family enzyme
LVRKIDCIRLPVDNLDEAIVYYGRLGRELIWRRPTQAGLRLPDTDAELVVQTENPDPEIDLLVGDADGAAGVFAKAGGRVVRRPFDIEVGRCVFVEDPWGSRLVLLDLRSGPLT